MLDHEIGVFSISIRCRSKLNVEDWVFSGVYGLNFATDVDDFLGEVDDIKGHWDLPWFIRGGILI